MKIKTYRFPDSVIQIKWIQLIKRHRSIEQKAKRAMKNGEIQREREKSQQQNDLLYFVFKFADLSFYEGNLTIQVKICLFPQLYFMLLD